MKCTIKLLPAEAPKQPGGFYSFQWEPFGDQSQYPTLAIEVKTLDELLVATRSFAAKHGKPCFAMIEHHERRKPRGFDDFTRTGNRLLWFNLALKGRAAA